MKMITYMPLSEMKDNIGFSSSEKFKFTIGLFNPLFSTPIANLTSLQYRLPIVVVFPSANRERFAYISSTVNTDVANMIGIISTLNQ